MPRRWSRSTPWRGEEQAHDVFEQLQAILKETDSDLRHLAKATSNLRRCLL
ncbi:MAG: RidA family protein [Planctomycetes bacterium]|nr:RidA family protein [Planctomycetota bacterium]